MLNVLIVDDEELVRTGIRYQINWEAFGMSVCAEAGSVDEALAILEETPDIDIVFTDILMPEKNGLDLLRHLRDMCPNIVSVVLSYSNDFEYIQRALRLGVFDYIIKNELGSNNFINSMNNIAQRARQNHTYHISKSAYKSAVVISNLNDTCFCTHTEDLNNADCYYPIGTNTHLLLYYSHIEEDALVKLSRSYGDKNVILHIAQLDVSIADLIFAIGLFFKRDFYYVCAPHLNLYSISPRTILDFSVNISGPECIKIEQAFCAMKWVWDDVLYAQLLSSVCNARLAPQTVYNMFYTVQQQQLRLFSGKGTPAIMPIANINYWYQWVEWLDSIRILLASQNALSSYNPQIVSSMQQLLQWIEQNFMNHITLSEAAKQINLSPSYISRCFKQIVGVNFNNYLRWVRRKYAEKMLMQSNLSIRRISELCGFNDYFYFEKVFKKDTGLSPSAYREKYKDTTH